jgi:thiol-disulfide isomerase/thioredoxin
MITRFPSLGLSLALFTALAVAQDKPAAPAETQKPAAGDQAKPAEREMPPELKAFNEANKITDPAKKVDALEKVKKDFPDTGAAGMADSAILNTLTSKMPGDTARIRGMAKAMYKNAEAKDKKDAAEKHTAVTSNRRASTAQTIASTLLSANILLKDAESWSKKSLYSMKIPVYLAEQREAYTKRKQNVPSDEELTKRFKQSRAARAATLGQIEYKLDKVPQAKTLLTEAYEGNHDNAAVAATLGEIAAKEGDDAKAFEFLMTAKLSGHIAPSANATFEEIYKKSHKGSLEGLESTLDSEYRKRFPNPVHPVAYQPTQKRTDRVVLAEVFTGSGCPPCVAADLAFDAAMQRYNPKELVVVMYHQHIPRPDPMTNPDTQARAKSYGVGGVPTYMIDGNKTVGGGPRDMAPRKFESVEKDIDKELESAPEAHIKVDATLAGRSVKVAANISGVKSESKDLKVQILLVEKELRYTGENGVRFHPMVVRALGGDKGEGLPIAPNGDGTFEATFDLDAVSTALKQHLDDYESKGHRGESFKFSEKKYRIDRADLAVVVFLQDDKTKHVLQTAYVDLGAAGGARSTNEAQ